MIKVTQHGDFKNTMSFLKKIQKRDYLKKLEKYAELGVQALSEATPKDTGKTADSWKFKIEVDNHKTRIVWTNDNINDGACIALLLQYGHGTRNGGWVQGIDYINPAMRPMFEEFANDAWKEVVGDGSSH